MGTRVANPVFHVTGVMHRKKPVYQAFLSQFPPSESSLIRKLAYDAVYLNRLRSANIPGVLDVQLHEATGSYGLMVIQLKKVHPSQPWQALHAAVALDPTIGKMIVAVDDDIDPNDADAVNWAMAYRMRPHLDTHIVDRQGVHPRPVVGAAGGARRRAALPAAGGHLVDPHRRHAQVGLPADLAAAQGVHGEGARALGGRGPAAADASRSRGSATSWATGPTRRARTPQAAVEGRYLETARASQRPARRSPRSGFAESPEDTETRRGELDG